jgi:hypothetical protein
MCFVGHTEWIAIDSLEQDLPFGIYGTMKTRPVSSEVETDF